jgi:hypothetical protein
MDTASGQCWFYDPAKAQWRDQGAPRAPLKKEK